MKNISFLIVFIALEEKVSHLFFVRFFDENMGIENDRVFALVESVLNFRYVGPFSLIENRGIVFFQYFPCFRLFEYGQRLSEQFVQRFFERIVPGLYFHGACGAAGVGCCGDGRGADVPGGDGTVGVHRGLEVVRGAPRDGPVDRDSYLVAYIEPDGLPVEFRCILLFAPCRSGSDACQYGE